MADPFNFPIGNPFKKPWNAEPLERDYLFPEEVSTMIQVAQNPRNSLLISMMYHHGLRVSETEDLRWSDIEFSAKTIRIRRRGKGQVTDHPLLKGDLTALKARYSELKRPTFLQQYLGEQPKEPLFVFGIKSRMMHDIIDTTARLAKIRFPVHPHMLRNSCGVHLAKKIKDPIAIQRYLGLKTLQSVMRFFELQPLEGGNLWD